MDNKKMIEFFRQSGKIKDIKRTGWVNNDVEDPESIADHSWRTGLMAMVLAERKGLNVENAMKMALLHDIAESEIGDYTPHEIAHKEKAEKERKAMRGILNNLGKQGDDLYDLWMEFEEQTSPEGELVLQIDKIEMVLQALEYELSQGIDLHPFIEHFERFGKKLPTDMQELHDEIVTLRKHRK